MTDPAQGAPSSSRCPWCSAPVAADTVRCPSCGATLREEEAADIPGVTHLDPAATVVRPAPRTRGLIGWLSGQYETESTDADRGSVEPPSDAVKQEMMRLEIEAIRVELEAQAAAEAAASGVIPTPTSTPEPPAAPAPDDRATGGGAAS